MNKNKITLLFSFLFALNSYGQNRHTDSLNTCHDITSEIILEIQNLDNYLNTDSLLDRIAKWQKHCGINEPNFRLKTIIELSENNESTIETIDYEKFKFIKYYELRTLYSSNKNNIHNLYFNGFDYVPFNSKFDSITYQLAEIYLSDHEKNTIQDFFYNLYTNKIDTAFKLLEENRLNNNLQSFYNQELESSKNQTSENIGILIGTWIPIGKLWQTGIHPSLGVSLGFEKRVFRGEINLSMRFLKPQNNYEVLLENYEYTSNYYLGGYIGLDFGYNLYQIADNKKIELISGIGFDGFDYTSDEDFDYPTSLNSFNFNIGLGYTLNYTRLHPFTRDIRYKYIRIEPKINFVNYKNPEAKIPGKVITLNFIFGLDTNFEKNRKLFYLNEL